jgi:hypothetical protein
VMFAEPRREICRFKVARCLHNLHKR